MKIPFSPSRMDSTNFLNKNAVRHLVANQSIIDIGCGAFFLPNLLESSKIKLNYLGIDTNIKVLDFKSKYINLRIVRGDFLNFRSKRKFDVVACLWTLEHIKNDVKALDKIFKITKKGGIAIIAVPSIWSWPIEFGRHGYRYYSKSQIIKLVQSAGFQRNDFFEGGGLLGLLFMIVYSWPRYLVLWPLAVIYFALKYVGITDNSWKKFSQNIISSLFYAYHKSEKGILLHNRIVSKIISLDNKLKIFPASYVLILKK